jgi:hypothetical protein
MNLIVILPAAYVLWLLCSRHAAQSRSGGAFRIALDVSFAAAFALAHFVFYPSFVIYDDGGIILKYMDNFAAGHFYAYNIADGPVFGISSFIHGIFSGALAWSHLLSPDNALLASNLVGMFLLAFALLRILRCVLPQESVIYPCWAVSLIFSRYLLITAKQGLETPLHLAIVLGGVLFMLRGRARLFWFFETLMVVSKLDALPIAALLAVAFIVRQPRAEILPLSPANPFWRRALLFAGVPALAWVVFAQTVFGSVLPQSARAKLFHVVHPSDSWFPFIKPFFEGQIALFTSGLLALLVAHIAIRIAQRQARAIFSECLLGLSAVGFLGLYYFYNPAEQMPWYYTLPDFFLTAQGLLSVFLFVSRFPGALRIAAGCVALIGYALFIWPDMSKRVIEHGKHFNVIETERAAVGRWIYAHSKPTDVVFAGHGHIARNTRRQVIDYTGLNSKIVTDLNMDKAAIIGKTGPSWCVFHGAMKPELATNGWRLVKSFYNVASDAATSASRNFLKGDPWRIHHRDAAAAGTCDIEVPASCISSEGVIETNGATVVRGSSVSIKLAPVGATAFEFGMQHAQRLIPVTIGIYDSDGGAITGAEFVVSALKPDDFENGYTSAFVFPLSPARPVARIEIKTGDTNRTLTVLAPLLAGVKREDFQRLKKIAAENSNDRNSSAADSNNMINREKRNE